jgi:plastocyanin
MRLRVIGWTLIWCMTAWCANVSGTVELTESKKDASGVVVWLEPLEGTPPDTPPQTATMAHHNKTFVPHVLAVRTGSKVKFPNQDPFFHNAFSNYSGPVFDIGLHPPGSSREVTLKRPGVVRLFCNIHPTMSAVIVVLNTPWFAVSNAAGAFHIGGVPDGKYNLKVFHERALADVLAKAGRQITVGPDDVIVSGLVISEAGYLAVPHKNKYGGNYPPVIVDQYPGRQR